MSQVDSAVVRLRRVLSEEPQAVRREILELLDGPLTVSERLRLMGLQIASLCRLGSLEEAASLVAKGRELLGASVRSFAKGEFALYVGEFELYRDNFGEARRWADHSVSLLGRDDGLTRSSPRGRRRQRLRRENYAAALLVRAEGSYRDGLIMSALRDAFEAVGSVEMRHSPQIHLSAASLVSHLLTMTGTYMDTVAALDLAIDAERVLKGRRFRRDHPYRVRLKWLKALAWARLGSTELADNSMKHVIERLEIEGNSSELRRAVEDYAWIGTRDAAPSWKRRVGDPKRASRGGSRSSPMQVWASYAKIRNSADS